MIIFTNYSESVLNYLRSLGNNVSRIDAKIEAGAKPKFIASHHRAGGGWKKGLDVTENIKPGEYLDEHAIMLNENDFCEWHGGERITGGI